MRDLHTMVRQDKPVLEKLGSHKVFACGELDSYRTELANRGETGISRKYPGNFPEIFPEFSGFFSGNFRDFSRKIPGCNTENKPANIFLFF